MRSASSTEKPTIWRLQTIRCDLDDPHSHARSEHVARAVATVLDDA